MSKSEAEIEKYLHDQVEARGGIYRRAAWLGRDGCPDDRIMIPGNCCWVEVKREGVNISATPHGRAQLREHVRMRACGEVVHVVSSFEDVDRVLG